LQLCSSLRRGEGHVPPSLAGGDEGAGWLNSDKGFVLK